jgi:hypothetical protein
MISVDTLIEKLNQHLSSPGPEDTYEELEAAWDKWLGRLSLEDVPTILKVCATRNYSDVSEYQLWWNGSLLECLSVAGRADPKFYLHLVSERFGVASERRWLIGTIPTACPHDSMEWLKTNVSHLTDDEVSDFFGRLYEVQCSLKVDELDDVRDWCKGNNKAKWNELLTNLKEFIQVNCT